MEQQRRDFNCGHAGGDAPEKPWPEQLNLAGQLAWRARPDEFFVSTNFVCYLESNLVAENRFVISHYYFIS